MNLVKSYFGLLTNINSESKAKLIVKLTGTLKTTKRKGNGSVKSLYGSFVSRKSAEELIRDVKKARTFKRTLEEF